MVVVKAALSVSHGQADVERGFSLNNQIVDDTRIALKERKIIALRTVKDVVNRFDNVDRIPVTSQLIRQFRGAHATYKADLESVAQASQDKEAEALTKVTEDKKKQTAEMKRVEIGKRQHEGEKLIAEASERLAKATSSKMNMTDILAAQALLNSGNTLIQETRKELQELEAPHKKHKK